MESYIVRIYRRAGDGTSDGIAGTVEDPVTGERASFRSVAGLMRWLGHGPRGGQPAPATPGRKKRKDG